MARAKRRRRSASRCGRVGVIQFLKPETANAGEIRAARQLGISVEGSGDGFTWTSKDLEKSAALARHGWEMAKERIRSGDYDVLVLDGSRTPCTTAGLHPKK